MDVDSALSLLSAEPRAAGIFSDFDGTLSPIVDSPDKALPVDGAGDVFAALARSFGLVAVVSGRSLEDLRSRFSPAGVVLAGSYGRERSDLLGLIGPSGRPARRATEGWEPVAAAAAAATGSLLGVVVERKGAGVALHYRLAPDLGERVREIAHSLADTFELQIRPGRRVYEIVAPGPGKGDAIRRLIQERGLQRVMVCGDDVADVEAFRIVRSLAVESVVVGVRSEEAPDDLEEASDVLVAGPTDLTELLGRLAAAVRGF